MRTANTIWLAGGIILLLLSVYFAIIQQHAAWLLIPFIILAAVWIMRSFEHAFLLLIASIPWSIEYNFTPSLGTDLPDEPLMLLVSFMAIGYMLYNRKSRPLKGISNTLFWVLILQLAWIAVTVIFSTSPIVSFKYLLAKSWYIIAFVLTPFILWKDKKILWKTLLVFCTSMLLFTTLAIVRHAQFGFTFEKINNALIPFFRNHVNYSAVLMCILPLLAAFYHFSNSAKQKKWLKIAMAVALTGLILSFARGAWLGLIAGAAAWWLIRRRILFYSYLLALLVLFAATFWLINDNRYMRFAHDYNTTIFHTDFQEHLLATYQFKDVSTAERFYRWVAGVRMVKYEWVTGYGPNTFSQLYKSYEVPAFRTWVSANEDRSTVHNYFLLTLIEQGIIGLLLLLTLLGVMFYKAEHIFHNSNNDKVKAIAACAAIILTMLCIVNFLSDLIETDKVGSLFYLTFSAIMIALFYHRSNTASHLERIS